jgi:hypothetical protein
MCLIVFVFQLITRSVLALYFTKYATLVDAFFAAEESFADALGNF